MAITKIYNPAQSLILENYHPRPDERVLVLEGGDGELALNVAEHIPGGEVLTLDRDIRNILKAENTLSKISNAATSRSVLPTSFGWNSALLTIPRERRFARALLANSWKALKPNGRLILAGATREGAKAVIKDAQRIFGNVSNLGYRNHQRVAQFIKGKELPDPLPKEFQQIGIAPDTTHFIDIQRTEPNLTLETHPGIFSWEAIDAGTSFLLDNLVIKPDSTVWDVGCGYGIIGLSTAVAGARLVWMSDTNLLSVDYSGKNAVRNRLSEKVSIFSCDGLNTPPEINAAQSFDLILSNPAFHQGRRVDKTMSESLISSAPNRLTRQGRLVIVANRFLNYDKVMRNKFAQVTKIAENSKFHIIEGRN